MNAPDSKEVDERLRQAGPGAAVYLIGAGGCGMSGLGHLLLDLGYRVAGSDLNLNEEIESLQRRGATIHTGHAPDHVEQAGPVLVVHTAAVRPEHPELQAASRLGIPTVSRAIVLAALVHRQQGICVAGMHGKTTTSAWLAFALDRLQTSCSFAIGGSVPQLGRPARFAGRSSVSDDMPPTEGPEWFVIEADESDGTLCRFHPRHAVLLNVDEEHLDHYIHLDAICREFQSFAHQTRGDVIYCADDDSLHGLLHGHGAPAAWSYGFSSEADYRIVNLIHPHEEGALSKESAAQTQFEVCCRGESIGRFAIRLFGAQNVSNATAVIALLHRIGYSPSAIAPAVAAFTGVNRRQQELFRDERYRVFDDYGHHPNEIRATIRAFKNLKDRRLLVAFQPHRYSRTRDFMAEFATCFTGADRLWLTDIYAASEPPLEGITGNALAEAVRAQGQNVEYLPCLDQVRSAVRNAMRPGDDILFLGAGDITRTAHELAALLRLEDPERKAALLSGLVSSLSNETAARRDEPLAKRTTLRVGGKADFFVEPASESDLASVLDFCRKEHLPFRIIGRGSNLLILDGGVRGVVISLAHANFSQLDWDGDRVVCGAGVRLKRVAMESKRRGVASLEFLEGIPGTVGGAMRMNAGAMGSWMFRVIERVRLMDIYGRVTERPVEDVPVEYRNCPLFRNHIALGAVLRGHRETPEAVDRTIRSYCDKRWSSQPAAPSAGCIFKNPVPYSAGQLIDELGLKGLGIGGAAVSDVHGNFIINRGRATAGDVIALIDKIKQTVRDSRGIELETEVEIIGENPLPEEHAPVGLPASGGTEAPLQTVSSTASGGSRVHSS